MSGSSNVVTGASSGASNSTPNPYRRYFRCSYAAKKRILTCCSREKEREKEERWENGDDGVMMRE
ncbi:hypothetical protein F2Q70_00019143 [Brassica cretica]|uniref:Uncharacterized protein n=1 Tax=Brassica cretica TaxID=69181 RepID=A0A8S9GPI4_BRACR|nr:hypothetical protein F2Q70_00019143 [Brassica cretica]